MASSPTASDANEKANKKPSRARWFFYGVGSVLATEVLLVTVLVVSQRSCGPEYGSSPTTSSEPSIIAPSQKNPQFPWPPPRASAIVVLPTEFVRKSGVAIVHFGDVDRTLSSALDSAGYFEKSYYAVPDGFAVVTRLEQIEADGTPKALPDRWALNIRPLAHFTLSDYLKALFTAKPGFYRVIVFIVGSESFTETNAEVSRSDAMAWLSSGLNSLPSDLREHKFTTEHGCTALIYEFQQPGSGGSARLNVPSEVQGRTHLERANLWRALAK